MDLADEIGGTEACIEPTNGEGRHIDFALNSRGLRVLSRETHQGLEEKDHKLIIYEYWCGEMVPKYRRPVQAKATYKEEATP